RPSPPASHPLSLHDALPISTLCPRRGLRRSPLTRPRNVRRESSARRSSCARNSEEKGAERVVGMRLPLVERLEVVPDLVVIVARSEEHTSELQSLAYLVCRL